MMPVAFFRSIAAPLWRHKFHLHKAILVRRFTENARTVLDIGCGPRTYEACLRSDLYVGVDVDGSLRPDIVASAESLPIRDRCFDVVIMFDVLEHVADACSALCEVGRVLRDDGRLLLTTPNTLGLGLYDSFADSTHVHHFTWRSIRKLLMRAGLSRIFPITLHLHSFWPLNLLRVRALIHVQQSICIVASKC